EPFGERPFEESSPEDPMQKGPTLNRPPLDEWTVDNESPAESTAADEPLGPETPPRPEEENPIAEEDTGTEAEEEDTDDNRRS
ncbi:MAG: hypothetical protein WD314_08905, partial [Trueperaceae bacterium]